MKEMITVSTESSQGDKPRPSKVGIMHWLKMRATSDWLQILRWKKRIYDSSHGRGSLKKPTNKCSAIHKQTNRNLFMCALHSWIVLCAFVSLTYYLILLCSFMNQIYFWICAHLRLLRQIWPHSVESTLLLSEWKQLLLQIVKINLIKTYLTAPFVF